MENTDNVIVGVTSGQDDSSSNSRHGTVDFRWAFWRPDPTAKYYFATVGESEAYNQTDWRTRTLTGFLQIVTVA